MNKRLRSGTIFDEMDAIHIQLVFEELADRFGFPEKKWLAEWRQHLGKQSRSENEISIFLRFGNDRIDPILNGLLLRTAYQPTFANLCAYIINKKRKG